MVENKKDEMSLDDEQRIKVLSPSRLVFKRFIRNRLAILGTVFILGMLIFSYVGGWLMTYEEDQVFTKYEAMYKVFAGVSENDKFRFIVNEGEDFPLIDQSQFVLATSKGEAIFSSEDTAYIQRQINENYYSISKAIEVGMTINLGKSIEFTSTGRTMSDAFAEMAVQIVVDQKSSFEFDGKVYYLMHNKKNSIIYEAEDFTIATKNVYSYKNKDVVNNYNFCKSVEDAINEGATAFTFDGAQYSLNMTANETEVLLNGEIFATVSLLQVEPIYDDVFIDLEFREVIKDAIINEQNSFIYKDQKGVDVVYRLSRQNLQWTIEKEEATYLVDKYSKPSKTHLLGTDGNGMDLLTRIMYGGRVSLRIGLIVVSISTFIGVILGGIAGYFGKFWDNLIMRIVDIFNCIPSLPLIIILGSVMDQQRIDPQIRLNVLMLILAVLGWPGIARMVRGQTLSLREQEFMTATEAMGLDVSKRIFKHLIPNIIPQLIVISTLDLGGVILMESTLSFLGVGVKFPFASWGNIINAVSNVHVLSNYLFVWIPAGMCILITVLGFNFIGDGLRDAFDPKMKR